LNGSFDIQWRTEKSGLSVAPGHERGHVVLSDGMAGEQFHGFLEPAQDHAGQAGLAPVPGLVEVGIDLPGTQVPGQRFLRLADVHQDQAHVRHVPLVVRIEIY
jgi:hypothetical protein